jgi:hypothetical protein
VSEQPEAKQVPLVERLESVPVDARLAVDDGPYSTSFYAVGAMAHEAAAELRRQHEVIAELLLVAKFINSMLVEPWLYEKARAAIAKAEGVKPPRIEGYNTNRDQPTFTIKEVKP